MNTTIYFPSGWTGQQCDAWVAAHPIVMTALAWSWVPAWWDSGSRYAADL